MLRRRRPFKWLARRSKLTLQKANDMQVTQTLSEGLKQEFKVVLPAGDLAAKLETQLAEMRAKAQIKGFRPGKAPISHLKKLYGKSLMSEVLQEAVNEANRKIVDDNKLRIAAEPKTSEVMESLGQQLCTNLERPSRVFLEIAANKLGLPYDLMDAFHEWFRFDRATQ